MGKTHEEFKLKLGCKTATLRSRKYFKGSKLNPNVKERLKLAHNGEENNVLRPVTAKQISVNATSAMHSVNLLIDTEAGVSLVNTQFIKQANLINKIQPTKTLIAGVERNLIPLRG